MGTRTTKTLSAEMEAAKREWEAMDHDEQDHWHRVCGYYPPRDWGEGMGIEDCGPISDPTDPNAPGM